MTRLAGHFLAASLARTELVEVRRAEPACTEFIEVPKCDARAPSLKGPPELRTGEPVAPSAAAPVIFEPTAPAVIRITTENNPILPQEVQADSIQKNLFARSNYLPSKTLSTKPVSTSPLPKF